jgi:spore germination protein KA
MGDNMQYLDLIRTNYIDVPDLIIKNIKDIYIIYLETLVNQDKINDYILKSITIKKRINNIKDILASPNIKNINNYNDLEEYLNSGFTIIIFKNTSIAIETKGELFRSIDKPLTEATLFGPKDSLNESIQTNIGLIKRRIRSSDLKTKEFIVGKYTKSIINILYMNSIAKVDELEVLTNKINNINIDGLNDISELRPFLIDDNSNILPGIKNTERPDLIVKSLLQGKLIILMDNSPYALILPSFLVDFINPISDDYVKILNVNFIKILRFICFFFSIIFPAFYIAITTFNQEMVPTNLLVNFQNQRLDVPFPAAIECLITLITCEILRESDLRFPSSYGSAISILGALVLGSAAVEAGIVSPIMIIVVAITFITSLIFTDLDIISSIRYWRFINIFVVSLFGIYGLVLTFIFFIANICNYEVLNKPYIFPISPFDLTYLKETLLHIKNNKRSKLLSNNNYKGDKT